MTQVAVPDTELRSPMDISGKFCTISRLGLRSHAFARHVYQKIAAVTIGRVFVSPAGRWARKSLAAFRAPAHEPRLRLAIVAHAYYPDILHEILTCRAVLGGDFPIYVTVPPERMGAVEAALEGVSGATIHPCENRGRDIWPFISLLGSGALDGYDAVLKLHTKRSPHLLDGEIRRKLLFAMLCGERNATLKALTAFEMPQTGLVGWRACWREAPPYWMTNRANVEALASRIGATDEASQLGFFEGSMFWFRPIALTALRELTLAAEDFEVEAGQVDGTLHHALERCFTIAAWSRGYEVRDLHNNVLKPSKPHEQQNGD